MPRAVELPSRKKRYMQARHRGEVYIGTKPEPKTCIIDKTQKILEALDLLDHITVPIGH